MQAQGTISFLVTTACQNRCLFCFERGSATTAILPTDFILRKVQERKPRSVDLAGGEPLLHPHLRSMAEAIRRQRVSLTVTTNGLALCDDALASFLAETVDRIVLSVHAGTREDYALVTGNAEGFDMLVRAISNLSAHVQPGQVLVNTTVTARTWPSIFVIPDLISQLRPLAWHVTNPMPLGAARQNYGAIVPRITGVRSGIDQVVQAARRQDIDVFFGFFPACALGAHQPLNSDLFEPGQAQGFQVDHDLNPHQIHDLVFERRFARTCTSCKLVRGGCAGPAAEYVRLFGTDELLAYPDEE